MFTKNVNSCPIELDGVPGYPCIRESYVRFSGKSPKACFKVVPEGYHKYFFGVKVKTVKLIGGTRFLAARSGLNGIHTDHGYLDTCDNPLGPP